MATFERYLLDDKEVQKEPKGWYYILRDNAQVCDGILDEFGVKGSHRHIINGHVPVRVGKGETPIKADGRLMVIDGGFSKVYHNRTGIAGYTLVYHSRGFELVQHAPFTSTEEAITNGTDIQSTTKIIESVGEREKVKDTDIGRGIMVKIADLERLLYAYRKGVIKERP
jgi:fructose-1,6-bisphosphatase-3